MPPLHRSTAAQATLADRCRDALLGHLKSVEKGPDGPLEVQLENTSGAHMERPGIVVSEKPGEQQDDDDECDKTATDVHSGLLCSLT